MILICDSGSTKADWVLTDGKKILSEFQTEGLNPVHLSAEFIASELGPVKETLSEYGDADEIFFFGAGCGAGEGKERIRHVLTKTFPGSMITVDNDLMAAALAASGKKKGIISILGTGSNCCYYDGITLHLKNFGLGYILGDEASGAWFGKKLLRAFLYEKLPENLQTAFLTEYQLTREKIIDAVYRKQKANLFLSSFMPFIAAYKEDAFIKELLMSGLGEFFNSNILAFEEAGNIPVHFVGSVAALLETEIRETGKISGVRIGKILKRPMDGLKEYFLTK